MFTAQPSQMIGTPSMGSFRLEIGRRAANSIRRCAIVGLTGAVRSRPSSIGTSQMPRPRITQLAQPDFRSDGDFI
jgi:hypothetical protein